MQTEDWLHRLMDGVAAAALALWEFYARVTTSSERPLYFVVLEVGQRPGVLAPPPPPHTHTPLFPPRRGCTAHSPCQIFQGPPFVFVLGYVGNRFLVESILLFQNSLGY